MNTEPYGPDALKAWEEAMSLVREHKYSEARLVNIYSSDRIALEKMIAREQAKVELAANAKGVKFSA